MVDNEKKTLKEKRQIRKDIKSDKDVDKKALRQKSRVDKLTEERKEEAKQFGIDPDKPNIGPLSKERKANIDKAMQEGVKEEFLGGLKKIQDLNEAPTTDIPKLKEDFTIRDVRKQRRAKVADILSSLGQGLQGKRVDPTMYQDRLKSEREGQYTQYKDASQAAKKRLREWEAGYIQQQLDYLNQKLESPKISELEKAQIDKARIQLENEQARLGITKEKLRQLKGSYVPPTADEDVKDEPTAKYVSKIGGDQTITRDIPISEAKERERVAKIKDATKLIDAELSQARLDLADMGEEGTKRREIFGDRSKRKNLEAKIESLEQQRKDIIEGIEGETSPTLQEQVAPNISSQTNNTKTEEDDLWGL